MTPFAELTKRGRADRLRALVLDVAEASFGLDEPAVALLSMHSFNTIFRLTVGERQLVMRVGDECRIHADGVEEVEAAWLDRLDVTGIGGPAPVRTPDGRASVDAAHAGVGGERVVSLFTFVPGRPLRERPTVERAVAAGKVFATIHAEAAAHPPPVPIPSALHADRVVYFHRDNLVENFHSVHGGLFREAIDRVQSVLDALWRSPPHRPHLLHGDFGPNNVLVHRGAVHPIDFQDLLFGFDVQDVGITLADLGRNAPELIEPLRRGYEQVRPFPDLSTSLLATFAAARSLNVMNLGLHLRRPGIAGFLDDHAARVAAWMREAPSTGWQV